MFAVREERLLTVHTYCESSISLEGGHSKDRVRLCSLSTSFQELRIFCAKTYLPLETDGEKRVLVQKLYCWLARTRATE